MHNSVFIEAKFWLLIVFSLVVPVAMYLQQLHKRSASPGYVLMFGLGLIAISGIDVYLLQSLSHEAMRTHSLADNAIFNSEISFSLYAFPALFGGVGINVISDIMVRHLMDAELQFQREHKMVEASPDALSERIDDAVNEHQRV